MNAAAAAAASAVAGDGLVWSSVKAQPVPRLPMCCCCCRTEYLFAIHPEPFADQQRNMRVHGHPIGAPVLLWWGLGTGRRSLAGNTAAEE